MRPTCFPSQVGFSGGLVVDFPNSTRAKKYFLVLMVGTSTHVPQVGDGTGAAMFLSLKLFLNLSASCRPRASMERILMTKAESRSDLFFNKARDLVCSHASRLVCHDRFTVGTPTSVARRMAKVAEARDVTGS